MASNVVFEPVASTIAEALSVLSRVSMHMLQTLDKAVLDTQLRPSLLVILTSLGTLSVVACFLFLRQLLSIRFKEAFFSWVRSLPFTQRLIRKEKEKLVAHLNKMKKEFLQDEKAITTLPSEGWSSHTVLNHLNERYKRNIHISQTESKVSGTVYLAGAELENLLCDVYKLHSLTNPLHPDVFPSVRQMEAEVVSICGSLLNPSNKVKGICGSMTGGGSESILTAVKASRDYMRTVRNITEPEMIIAQSAHAAFHKAAEYFNIKPIILRVDKDYRMPVHNIKRRIGHNTILIVASAPGFPHGVIDPIEEISEIATETGTLFHVDCCLGGFFLPFVRKLGVHVLPFDFSLRGVTSMSIDTHKYGMAHKGTSVVLYRSPVLRKHQYTAISDWSGGMYISPGFAGSRSGALIATSWASLMHIGEKGYLTITENILNAINDFKTKLKYVPDLEVVGDPIGCVVAVKFKKNPERIYQLNDVMTEKGWHLTPLQFPPALHISFTARHVGVIDRLVQDLRVSVEATKAAPAKKNGTAAIYGAACSIPDRRIVQDLLVAYQDALLSP